MALDIENNSIKLIGNVMEDDTQTLYDCLANVDDCINIDMTQCDDIHFQNLQLIMAYMSKFSCDLTLKDDASLCYMKAIAGYKRYKACE
jgi:hypothetical protein